ncbi:putative protein-like [Capsicum annuum]|nr:putative protein-like [Capsicum annuum]
MDLPPPGGQSTNFEGENHSDSSQGSLISKKFSSKGGLGDFSTISRRHRSSDEFGGGGPMPREDPPYCKLTPPKAPNYTTPIDYNFSLKAAPPLENSSEGGAAASHWKIVISAHHQKHLTKNHSNLDIRVSKHQFSNAAVIDANVNAHSVVQSDIDGVHGVKIDLDNEYDHATIWIKGKMYIGGYLMRFQIWTLTFKPDEETPLVPVWAILPELPWHCYCMEFLAPLLSPIGKALFLDLSTYKKTRGNKAKVKIQIDRTKSRPHHVWLGFDEDENGEGKWKQVHYEGVPEFYTYCKH